MIDVIYYVGYVFVTSVLILVGFVYLYKFISKFLDGKK